MKRSLASAAILLLAFSTVAQSQERVKDGPWRFFKQEHPPLSYQVIATPFVVRNISGSVLTDDGKPLEGASVEIELKDGMTLGTDTDSKGVFELQSFRIIGPFVRSAKVNAGTYRFKVTKDGCHSAVGTIVVSRSAPKDSVIRIKLETTEAYRVEQAKRSIPPNEILLPPGDPVPPLDAKERKRFPQKYSLVYVPVSLAQGRVRTSEFVGSGTWYDIMIQVEKPLPFLRMECMMAVTSSPLERNQCGWNDPVLKADWTVWQDGRIVHHGTSTDSGGDIFTKENIYKMLGMFSTQKGEKYVVQVHFTKDGSELNVANPRLIIIRHEDMWGKP